MTALGTASGIAIDQLVGEPPVALHPVAHFGSIMQALERRIYRDRRLKGVGHLLAGVTIATSAGILTRRLFGRHVSTAFAVAICAAGRMLDDEARHVANHLREGDIDSARQRVRSLVGRNSDALDEEELARAVIESVAENLVDAVTATSWSAAIAGSTGAFVHRAVNTLDAMVGHHDERYENFGWASARLDDVLNFLPSRATALAICIARPRRARRIWHIVRRDAHRHPSPNGGIVEAAFAAALDIRLGGVNTYGETIEDRGFLGDGRPPTVDDIELALRLRRHTTLITVGVGSLIPFLRMMRRWRPEW
ncbi:MAG: adenosylcobinamide-phosphate synthase CbiB [Actinomycetota bacterium]